jgi:arylsulfatase A-like enzyme
VIDARAGAGAGAGALAAVILLLAAASAISSGSSTAFASPAASAISTSTSSGRSAASASRGPSATSASHHPARRQVQPAGRPNIVFILTDDLAWNLIQYMPHVLALAQRGATFSNYFVTDSLCCPSRSSIFSGRYPHDTGVFTNGGADGGFLVFHDQGEERTTFATALQAAGYRTAMMGKYLNGYEPSFTEAGPKPYIPPGWNEWDVAGNAYSEFNYTLNQNGQLFRYGHRPQDYLTDVLSKRGTAFVRHAARAHSPFFMEIATFAPHIPYTPAPRDVNDFPGLTAPMGPAFNMQNINAPSWLADLPALNALQLSSLDRAFRLRAQSLQAVDRMLASLENTLAARGLLQNTYIVFSSDNGYHMGEHRLTAGKLTAFDTDIKVPLIVAGPGVPASQTLPQMTENIDLNPTFSDIGNAVIPPSVDGRSLLPLLRGQTVNDWANAILVEHHGPDFNASDPDNPPIASGNPTSYEAIRTTNAVYVEYNDGETEYYDLTSDPNELDNTVASLSPVQQSGLHNALIALENCHDGASCSTAGRVGP